MLYIVRNDKSILLKMFGKKNSDESAEQKEIDIIKDRLDNE